MATITAHILVGSAHPNHGGILRTHSLFLSENSRPAWTLAELGAAVGRRGSTRAVVVADEVWERRRREGRFTSTFAELRCALFFLQRSVRNAEQSPGWQPGKALIEDVLELYAAIVEAWSERMDGDAPQP